MNFELATGSGYRIEHCFDCAVPGYLIVSPVESSASLSDLPPGILHHLGPVLAIATRAVQEAVAPLRVYCALFSEQRAEVHFHVFPRTLEVTNDFLHAHPEQRGSIHGPMLLDWARTYYRTSAVEVWRKVSPICGQLKGQVIAIAQQPVAADRDG